MDRLSINLTDMFQSVDLCLETNKSEFQDREPLQNAHQTLHKINTDIFSLRQQQAQSETQKTVSSDKKRATRGTLVNTAEHVADGLMAIAAGTNDKSLKAVANIRNWELKNMRDNDFVYKLLELYNIALTHVEELPQQGVTESELQALHDDALEFHTLIPGNQNQQKASTTLTGDIKTKVSEGKALLADTIDPLMKPFKTINPAFYTAYTSARRIIERAATHNTSTETKTTI